MRFEEDSFYHIYNRSFNKIPLFYNEENFHYFKRKINTLTSTCHVLAYCLMPDHFHLLIYIPNNSSATRQTAQSGQTGIQELSRKIGTVLSSYTQAINKQELRRGSLFQPKTKNKKIENNTSLLNAFHYIHQNPIRAGLVAKIEDWRFSSFSEYYLRKFELVNQEISPQFIDLIFEPEQFRAQSMEVIPDHIIEKINIQ